MEFITLLDIWEQPILFAKPKFHPSTLIKLERLTSSQKTGQMTAT